MARVTTASNQKGIPPTIESTKVLNSEYENNTDITQTKLKSSTKKSYKPDSKKKSIRMGLSLTAETKEQLDTITEIMQTSQNECLTKLIQQAYSKEMKSKTK